MLYTILTRYFTVLVQFFIIATTIHIFGAEARGIVAGLIAAFSLIGVLSSFTIGKGLISLVEKFKHSNKATSEVYCSAVLGTIFLIAISVLIHFFFLRFFPDFYGKLPSDIFRLFYLSVGYFVWSQVGTYLYSLTGQLRVYNTINFVSNSSMLIFLMSIRFIHEIDFHFFIFILSIIYCLEFLVGIIFFIKKFKLYEAKPCYISRVFKSGATLHIDSIGGVMFSSISLILVNMKLTLTDVADYDIAIKIFSLLCLLPQMMQLFNHRKVVNDDTQEFISTQLGFLKKVTVVYILLYPVSLVFLYFLLEWVDYELQVLYLYAILALAFIPYFYCSIISPFWIKQGNGLKLSAVTLIIGTIGIILSFSLMGVLGSKGAAMAIVINYVIAALINQLYHKHNLSTN